MAAKTFDEVYLVNYSSYDDVNLYEVGCQKCDPSYGYGPIIRKLYILHYVVSGEGLLRIQNKEFAVKEHDIFVIPAHTPSYYEAGENNPWNYIWIQFDGFKIPFSPCVNMPQKQNVVCGIFLQITRMNTPALAMYINYSSIWFK